MRLRQGPQSGGGAAAGPLNPQDRSAGECSSLSTFRCGLPPSSSSSALLNTGDVWHVALEGLPGSGICYGYRVSGTGGWDSGFRWDGSRVLLDPYAPLVSGRRHFGKRDDIERFEGKVGFVEFGSGWVGSNGSRAGWRGFCAEQQRWAQWGFHQNPCVLHALSGASVTS